MPSCNPNSVPAGAFLTHDSYWKEGLGTADVVARVPKLGLLACKKSGEKLIAAQVGKNFLLEKIRVYEIGIEVLY